MQEIFKFKSKLEKISKEKTAKNQFFKHENIFLKIFCFEKSFSRMFFH